MITGALSPGQEHAFNLNGTAVTSGEAGSGSSGTGGSRSSGGHTAPCSGLTGVSLARCRAKRAYTSGLAGCNAKYRRHGKSGKAKDAACRKRITTAYHRALAAISCSQIKNSHKRAMCVAQSRRIK